MNRFEKSLLSGAAAVALGAGLLAPTEVNAQSSAPAAGSVLVTQTGTHADAATFVAQNTRTSCTTTQDSVANLTLTITPPAGNYVYLTGVNITVAPNATGAASAVAWSTTNMPGNLGWMTSVNAATTLPAAPQVNEQYANGLKSVAAGTAVTIVPNVTMASAYQCIKAVGFYAPQ